MDIETHFLEYIKARAEGFNYDEIYRGILEDGEYCLIEIRTMILVSLYNLDLNYTDNSNVSKHKMVLNSYLNMLGKEKHKPLILIEQLLYIVYICKKVSNGIVSQSPTAPEGLYC